MTNHIVLFQPQIPGNTGSIARTCAGTYTHLHLIKPLGFSTDDKMLKRAGLDYWDSVNISYYENIESFFESTEGEYYLLTKFGETSYLDVYITDEYENHYYIFIRYTTRQTDKVKHKYKDTALRIQMNDNISRVNISNTASLIIYQSLKQQNFPNLH